MEISVRELKDQLSAVLRRVGGGEVVVVTSRGRAGDLADRLALRGYDSVQLAAAEEVLDQCGPRVDLGFAESNRRLTESAAALGMRTVPGLAT